ncbi:MAG TPA: helix-turn-helix transcriptional regulator [Thermoanaerobaculia bacterium]|jgi:transcriptional regulator with XRE-family HTH domain|nr:helix-turn-helix transcriptional regulator [Thermoanaerobaculia bacterium]
MIDDDLHSLRVLLREAIASLRLTNREAESAMGIAHGSLEGLLQGRLDLRVRHLLALAEILKVSPADFLALGCPTAQDAAQHDLVEWLSPPVRGRIKGAPTLMSSATSSDLADLVRKTIREELARARRGPNGPEEPES